MVFTTVKPVGGINASDAAQVNAWGVGPHYLIEKVRFFAGDVIRDNYLNSSDAGNILAYFMTNGNPPSPILPKWTFWKTNDEIAAQNPLPIPRVLTLGVTGGGGPIVQDFYALVSGDFNRSFTPGSAKSLSESVLLNQGEILPAELNSIVDLPVIAGENMEVGALSLILNFPSDKLEILGVTPGSDANKELQYSVSGDELRIGWYSVVPYSLKAADRLLTVKIKVVGSLTKDEILRFNLAADELVELADENYTPIPDARLTMDVIGGTALGMGDGRGSRLTLANQPNPFKGTTTFTYTLPVDGKVTLEISNMLGLKVMSLLDEKQTAGSHSFTLDNDVLTPGVYTATLKLDSQGTMYARTIKIVRSH